MLFDMLDGLTPVRGVLGLSDPDVHWLDGRWTMFLGGFPPCCLGCPLAVTASRLVTRPDRPRRPVPLTPDPPRGAWDAYGMHTPSYVRAAHGDDTTEERVYYAVRAPRANTGPTRARPTPSGPRALLPSYRQDRHRDVTGEQRPLLVGSPLDPRLSSGAALPQVQVVGALFLAEVFHCVPLGRESLRHIAASLLQTRNPYADEGAAEPLARCVEMTRYRFGSKDVANSAASAMCLPAVGFCSIAWKSAGLAHCA